MSVSPATLSGKTRVAFQDTISASGGVAPYTYSIVTKDTNSLKNFTIDPATGVLSGIPKRPNQYPQSQPPKYAENNITIRVTDSNSCFIVL